MARLRDDYHKFVDRKAEIIVIAPDSDKALRDYWYQQRIPFIGIPDPHHLIAGKYGQQVKILKLGRMPALMVVDKLGRVRYKHYADSMSDIPENQEILTLLDNLNRGMT
jgi:peroxiredoxin Q/BCP